MFHHSLQGDKKIYCSSWQTGSLEARSRADTPTQVHPAGSSLPGPSRPETQGYGWDTCKATTRILIQANTRSASFTLVWLLVWSVRCKHRQKARLTCCTKFTCMSEWHTRESHRNMASFFLSCFLCPSGWSMLGFRDESRDNPARDKSQEKPRAGIIRALPSINS